MSRQVKKYTSQEKMKVAIEASSGQKTMAQITSQYGVHGTQILRWKKQLQEGAVDIFGDRKSKESLFDQTLISELYTQIGQLTVELNWVKKKAEWFGG